MYLIGLNYEPNVGWYRDIVAPIDVCVNRGFSMS